MGSRNNLEQVLRDIRVFLSNGREYEKDADYVVVDKQTAYELLSRFMNVLEEIKDDYELTKQGREQSEREAKQRGDYIVKKANVDAEDVYAASVLYTDDALSRVEDYLADVQTQMEETLKEFSKKLKKHQDLVRDNKSELKAQLRNMTDTKKYLHLMEEENRRRELEKKRKDQESNEKGKPIQNEGSTYAKPDIKINRAYFEEHGIPLPEEESSKTTTTVTDEPHYESPEIRVNLDSEYFKWKQQQSDIPASSAPEIPKHQAPVDDLYAEDDENDWKPPKRKKFFGRK